MIEYYKKDGKWYRKEGDVTEKVQTPFRLYNDKGELMCILEDESDTDN